ncbi:uncharacterized protein [Porites lutea]|uniref:uncharacterized protein n=1 Tax=Porites lutea TaxID=51062 RepID=UPI003CC69A75
MVRVYQYIPVPVLASYQKLSPRWQRVNSLADAPPLVWRSLHLTSLSWGKIQLSLAAEVYLYQHISLLPSSVTTCSFSEQSVNSSADAPPRALSKSFVVNTTRPSFRIEPFLEKESRVERTLYVNTWLLILILLLLALVLGKRVFKKVSSSWLKVTHPKDVQGTRAEDQERTGGIEEDFTTDNTDIMHESALLLNYDNESPELNQQVCTAETKGACVHRGDLPFQVQGDLVVYMNMDTVNMNTMSMNMNTTNNVELQQNGGVTVVGDKTNINYHQPPQ